MESLKSQISLRTLDASGRSFGTERPSTQPSAGAGSDLIEGFGQRIGRESSDARNMAGNSHPRSHQRQATEAALRAARSEASQAEDRMRDDRVEFSRQAGEQHASRRARLQREDQERSPEEAPVPAPPSETTRTDTGSVQQAPNRGAGGPAATQNQAAAPDAGVPTTIAGQAEPGASMPAAGNSAVPAAGASTPSAIPGTTQTASAVQRVDAATQPAATSRTATSPTTATRSAARATSTPQGAPAPDVDAQKLLEQVRLQLNPALRQATLALTPEHLGRIAIRMEMKAGELTAVVRAERPETLAALQANIGELRETLAEAGIEAGDIDLGLAGEDDTSAAFSGTGEGDEQAGLQAARRLLQTYQGDESGAHDSVLAELGSDHIDLYA